MISRQSLQFMRFPGRAEEPESFTALPSGARFVVWSLFPRAYARGYYLTSLRD